MAKLSFGDVGSSLDSISRYLAKLSKTMSLTDAFEELRKLGLLAGIERLQEQSKFLRRLEANADEKRNLARYFLHKDNSHGIASLSQESTRKSAIRSLFFESGSTIAFVIGEFSKHLIEFEKSSAEAAAASQLLGKVTHHTVITNNMFALTALADFVGDVQPIQGSLRTKYYGFFPFLDTDGGPQDFTGDRRIRAWVREFAGYDRLSGDINEIDVVFATCSDFSFLAGPLVGSRANALTKHAMYWGRNRDASFVLVLDYQKIVSLNWSDPAPAENTDGSDNLSRCYCVFPVTDSMKQKFKNVSESFNCGDWHLAWLDNPKEAITNLSHQNAQLGGLLPRNLHQQVWLQQAAGVRIVIGLPNDDEEERDGEEPSLVARAMTMIQREVEVANDLMSHLYNLRYEIREDVDPHEWKVCEIEIVETGN